MKKYGKMTVILGSALALSVAGFGYASLISDTEGGVLPKAYTQPLPGEFEEYQKVTSEDGGEAYFGSKTTVILDGQSFDINDRVGAVNGIFNIQAVDGYWLVHGHISPNVGYYGFYNRETLQWEKEFLGAPLTWYGADEAENDIPFSMDTVVYTFWNDLYDSNGTLIQTIETDESESEYIRELKRTSTGVEVYLLNASMEERMVLIEDLPPICLLQETEPTSVLTYPRQKSPTESARRLCGILHGH